MTLKVSNVFFKSMYSVHMRAKKVEKLITLFHVYDHQARRFCQALGQYAHLKTTCVYTTTLT